MPGPLIGSIEKIRRRTRVSQPKRLLDWRSFCRRVYAMEMAISFPDWIEPMAATLTQERFTDPAWIFERKFDGIRVLAFRNGPDIRLLSRNRLPQHLPAIAASIAALPVGSVVLDGEVTWGTGGTTYHVFDLMWLDGRDVTSEPLEARLTLLADLPRRPRAWPGVSRRDQSPGSRGRITCA